MKAATVIIFNFLAITFGAEWSYDYETQWPDKCRTGTQQSPINIMTRDALVDRYGVHIRGPLVFSGYDNVQVTAENNGHTLKWSRAEGTPEPKVSGGPLRGEYSFKQFHLHWLSEHAVDGMKYPLEIHMVHVKTGLSVEEALMRDDGLAVIGVLFQVYTTGDESEFALQQLMPQVPYLVDRNADFTNVTTIDISRFFSPQMQSFYTYHGSLTTPNCQEVVTWIVMDQPVLISDDQYKQFHKVDIGRMDNYRSLQAVNRVVYRSVVSCASILSPSFLLMVAAALNCFSSKLSLVLNKGACFLYNAKKKIFGGSVKECTKLFQ